MLVSETSWVESVTEHVGAYARAAPVGSCAIFWSRLLLSMTAENLRARNVVQNQAFETRAQRRRTIPSMAAEPRVARASPTAPACTTFSFRIPATGKRFPREIDRRRDSDGVPVTDAQILTVRLT
jgi:hypothetical protein